MAAISKQSNSQLTFALSARNRTSRSAAPINAHIICPLSAGNIRCASVFVFISRCSPSIFLKTALLLLYDVTNKVSFDNIRAWLVEIREYAQEDVVIILLGECGRHRHRR